MKKIGFSIKLRVTVWYMLLFVSITALMAMALFTGVRRTARVHYEDILAAAMTDASESVRYVGGRPRMDFDDVTDFDKITFCIFDENGGLWQGRWPAFELDFEDGSVRTVGNDDGHDWMVQDLLLPFAEGDVWLRGYLSLDTVHFLEAASANGLYLALPGLILLAGVGGYFLTQRAFRPIVRMATQADKIAEGRDLKWRFGDANAGRPDEFSRLAQTFNNMFARLDASFRRERQFTDDASHELRTPIAVINAACEYALSQDDPAEYRDALVTIREKAAGMNEILAQLLQMARMDGGRIIICREEVDFSLLCRSTAEEMAANSEKQLDMSGVEPGVLVEGDELLLMRAVMNLVDNALKFSDSRVWMTLTRSENMACLRVRDDGPGMSPEVLARVFDRFYQAAPDRNAQKPGAGLGLSIARQILHHHGGEIHAESTPGAGAEFSILLPEKNS